MALQWGQRVGMEFPPSLKISCWLCLQRSRQCLWNLCPHRMGTSTAPSRSPVQMVHLWLITCAPPMHGL
eukprot:9486665-Pyramimonas_sp.AAC.1